MHKVVNAKFRYRGFDIYTRNGEFTVGGIENHCFDDCTLENFHYVSEYDAVRWLREKGYGVKFFSYQDYKYVPYESYLEHLINYQFDDVVIRREKETGCLFPDYEDINETMIVPKLALNSIAEVKEFIDWIIDQSATYVYPELRMAGVKYEV
jgi:hypothetical protein